MERRGATEFRAAAGNRLEGYAALFNSPSVDLGGFTEVIRPGAFARSLSASPDVLALFDHDARHVLGRTTAGTLRLAEDNRGLRFEIDVPPTQTGRDLLVSVGRGDISGASFAFRAKSDTWIQGNAGMLRELHDLDLLDVTVTANPAYPATTVARRALGNHTGGWASMARRYLATLEVI
ncbi:MAG: HK97 family phage prohead protease [Proteobacteria bacterium]|nr:HK97 family phage prohead protease [Pseudomonadota bacterium]